jgi:hypothetical protein
LKSSAQQKSYRAQLKKVGRQIEHWRNTRPRMGRMPKELWGASVQLAEHLSVQVVAKEFGLGYRKLKRLVEQRQAPSKSLVKSNKPTVDKFIELPSFEPRKITSVPSTVFEWSRADGARLTIRLSAGQQQEVNQLAHTLIELLK